MTVRQLKLPGAHYFACETLTSFFGIPFVPGSAGYRGLLAFAFGFHGSQRRHREQIEVLQSIQKALLAEQAPTVGEHFTECPNCHGKVIPAYPVVT